VDSGVCRGQRISPYYDSLLAKVCVWGPNRPVLLERMRRATREFGIAGVVTNLEFHETLLSHPQFIAGEYDTRFVDQNPDLLGARPASDEELAAFVVASHLQRANVARPRARTPSRWAASFRP
jgi:acetyl-CoA carboxylase biotin carboxylase subunit